MHNNNLRRKDLKRLEVLKSKQYAILEKIKHHIPKKKRYLTQSSFEKGTVRITKPGIYVLKENITFAPNPDNDFRPYKSDPKYKNRAYSLGFFAAITIECDGVEIDLNGYTLQQGDKMAWMQRFYANIETASTPFIPGQGPGNFGAKITSPKYIYIHDGTLGRSSHHAIHGNGNKYLWVSDVKMVDYEFVGSAINGGHYIVHKNCKVLHNFKDLKVLATWSAALFAQQFADDLLEKMGDNNSYLISDFRQRRNRLQIAINQTKRELFSGRPVSNPLFRNDRLIADGNVYGILTHPLGVAIHEFTDAKTMEDQEYASYFYVDNCEIRDLEGDVDEVISFVDSKGTAMKGPSGDLLKLSDCMKDDGAYRGNVISDLIMGLAKMKKAYPDLIYGTLNISDDVLDWSEGRISYFQLKNRGYKFLTGQDSMAHTGKGVLGIRIDGTEHVFISHNTIYNVQNQACLGSEYNSATAKPYLGTIASGIHISQAKNVWVVDTLISNIKSYNGESAGIKGINYSSLFILHSDIRGISAGKHYQKGKWYGRDHDQRETVYKTVKPNECPTSKGLCWSHGSKTLFKDLNISQLKGPQVYYIAVIN